MKPFLLAILFLNMLLAEVHALDINYDDIVQRGKIIKTSTYQSYNKRNNRVSEKIVAIYDKRSPAYGYRYVLYTPIGNHVGHRKIMQPNLNGYGYSPIPDGGENSQIPCFKTIQEAKHYYYPLWY